MNVYICRHGQTHWNQQQKLQGQFESELTELGINQALDLSSVASKWNISAVMSSSLIRAKQTAQICAESLSLPYYSDSAFNERNFGDWQGCFRKDLTNYTQFRKDCYFSPETRPNSSGESTEEVRNRFTKGLLTFRAKHPSIECAMLISHGDAIDCFVSMFAHPHRLQNCQYIKVEIKKDNTFKYLSTNVEKSKFLEDNL